MKTLTYQIMGYANVYNPETKEVEKHESPAEVVIECPTQAIYDSGYCVAEEQAIAGTIRVSGEYDTAEPTDAERIAQLEEALEMLLSGVTE